MVVQINTLLIKLLNLYQSVNCRLNLRFYCRVVADDNRGDILEPAPIPDVPQRAIVVYSYPLAAETWMVKTALREMVGLSKLSQLV